MGRHRRVCTHTEINVYSPMQMPAVWHGADDLTFHSPLLNTSSCSYRFPSSSAWSLKSSRVSQEAGMWPYAGVQRDTDTKMLRIHLIKPAMYLCISGKQAWALQTSESHTEGPKLLFFLCVKTNVGVMRKRNKKDKNSSFVRWSAALPKSLLNATKLQSEFSDCFDLCIVREFSLTTGTYLWRWNYPFINSCSCLKLVSGVSSSYLFKVLTWSPSS